MDLKRARMEKDELESSLFELFDRQSNWDFRQLIKETEQPAIWLKELPPPLKYPLNPPWCVTLRLGVFGEIPSEIAIEIQ